MLYKRLLTTLLLVFTVSGFAANKPITVILDWFVNPDHAPLIVAQQQGYFKQHGLDVHIVTPADPNDGPKLVAAGKAEITITYQAGLLQDIERGLPLLRAGTLFPVTLNAVAVLQEGPIKKIEDLKGKIIGSSAAEVDQAFIGALLKQHGLTLKDVTIIDVHYNLVQALLAHKVDAISGIMRNFEPIQMALLGKPARLFLPEENGVPNSDAELWVVNRQNAKAPWVREFLLAIQEGTAYLKKHPQETWQQFAKAYPELNNPLNERSWEVTYHYFSDDPFIMNEKSYETFARFMQKEGLLKNIPSLESYTILWTKK